MKTGDVVGYRARRSTEPTFAFYCCICFRGQSRIETYEQIVAGDIYPSAPACKACGDKLPAISVVNQQRATDHIEALDDPTPYVNKTLAAMADAYAAVEAERDALASTLGSIAQMRSAGCPSGRISDSDTLGACIRLAQRSLRTVGSMDQRHGLGLTATRERAAALGLRVTALGEHNARLLDAVAEGLDVIDHYLLSVEDGRDDGARAAATMLRASQIADPRNIAAALAEANDACEGD